MAFLKIVEQVFKNPLLVSQAFQVSGLLVTGDLIGQVFINKKKFREVDYIRTVRVGVLGATIIGTTVSSFFKILALTVDEKNKYVGIKKMLIDQLIFVPFIFLPLFMISVNVYVNCNSWKQTKEEMKNKYFSILLTNYKIWPLVQTLNFSYVPIPYQVFVTQSVAVLWNTYLIWKTVNVRKEESKQKVVM
ncbi:mpv17-like protein isoform X1 [Diabrotica virgifera virgifera]|uniref:Mitochondrial inner membrane protein Mpv17 n=1 Tax=Diabrotica virgifera virgifera TaxID=50390 RepID=A0A6P7GQY2_DIAVI|nr:mpv17-like protein isoform X1 [Diabrotica virgifera virgifera]